MFLIAFLSGLRDQQHGPVGRPLRRFLPVRVRQLHQGDHYRRRQDVADHVQRDQRLSVQQTPNDHHRTHPTERTETVQNGQVALQIVHGQRCVHHSSYQPATVLERDKIILNAIIVFRRLEKIEKQGLGPIKAMLKNLGGWPVLEGEEWNEADFTWKDSVYKFKTAGYSVDYFIDFSISTDLKNTTTRAIDVSIETYGLFYCFGEIGTY